MRISERVTNPHNSFRFLRSSLTDENALSLEVRGRPFSQRPFDVQVLLGEKGSTLLTKPVRSTFFAPGASRAGFARSVADLASRCSSIEASLTMIADALATAFDDLAERIGAGSVVVADVQARKILSSTDRMIFTPETGRWTVVFGREYDSSRYEYDVKKATFSASEWADHSARGKPLPSSVRRARDPDPFPDYERGTARWRACRSAWSAVAEVGPEPPSVEPIELESPGTSRSSPVTRRPERRGVRYASRGGYDGRRVPA